MKNALLQAPQFESGPCSQCAGTGMRALVECPRCDGNGSFLTRRGQAARAFMKTLTEKSAADIVVGDVVWFPVGGVKVATPVLRVEVSVGTVQYVRLHGKRRGAGDISFAVGAQGVVELAHTPHELEAIRVKVEAHQTTLTKNGDVSTRPSSIRRDNKKAA